MDPNLVLALQPVTAFETSKSPFTHDCIFHNILQYIPKRSLPKLRLVSQAWNRNVTKFMSHQDYIVDLKIEDTFERIRKLTETGKTRGDHIPLVNFRVASPLNIFCDELTTVLTNFFAIYAPLITHLEVDTNTLYAMFPKLETETKYFCFPNLLSLNVRCRIYNEEHVTWLLKIPWFFLKRILEESPNLMKLNFRYHFELKKSAAVISCARLFLSVLNGICFEHLKSVEINGNYFDNDSLSAGRLNWKLKKLVLRIVVMEHPSSLTLLLSTVNDTLVELDLVCSFKVNYIFPVVLPTMTQLETLTIRFEEPLSKNIPRLQFESYKSCFPKLKTLRIPYLKGCLNFLFSVGSEESHLLDELDFIQNALSNEQSCSIKPEHFIALLQEISKTFSGLKRLTLHTIHPIEHLIDGLAENKNLTQLTVKNSDDTGKSCNPECCFTRNVYLQMVHKNPDECEDKKSVVEVQEIVLAHQHRIRALSFDLSRKLTQLRRVLIRIGKECEVMSDPPSKISKWNDRVVFKISLMGLGSFTCEMDSYDLFCQLKTIYNVCGALIKSTPIDNNEFSTISHREDLKRPTATMCLEAIRPCQQTIITKTHALQIDSVVLKILRKLPVQDVLPLRLVCKSWNKMARVIIREKVYTCINPSNDSTRRMTEITCAIRTQGQEFAFVNLQLSDRHIAGRRISIAQSEKVCRFLRDYSQVLQRFVLSVNSDCFPEQLKLKETATNFNFPQLNSFKIFLPLNRMRNANIVNLLLKRSPNLQTLELNYYDLNNQFDESFNCIVPTVNGVPFHKLDNLTIKAYCLGNGHYEALANLNLRISMLELRLVRLPNSSTILKEFLSSMTGTLRHLRITCHHFGKLSGSSEMFPVMKQLTTLIFPSSLLHHLLDNNKNAETYGKQFPELKMLQIEDGIWEDYFSFVEFMPPIPSLEEIDLPSSFDYIGRLEGNSNKMSYLYPNLKRLTISLMESWAFSEIVESLRVFANLEEVTLTFADCCRSKSQTLLSRNEIRSTCYPCLIYRVVRRLKNVSLLQTNDRRKIMRKLKLILGTLMLSAWKIPGLNKLTLRCLECEDACGGRLDYINLSSDEENSEDSQNAYESSDCDPRTVDWRRITKHDKKWVGERVLKIEIPEFGSYGATFYDKDRSITDLGGLTHRETQC